MKETIRKFFNYSINKKNLGKLFLAASISLLIPTSVSHFLLISSKNKVINKNDYIFQDSKLLGYKWVDFKPSSKFKDLESYENYFEEYLKTYSDDSLPKKLTNFISSQYIHEPLKYKCSYNWLGCVLERTKLPYISETLFVLKPKDIAKAKNAFCSQQAILVQHILGNLGFNYASLGVSYFDKDKVQKGHFFTISFINGKSYLIDTDMKPKVNWKGDFANNFLSNKLSESTFYEMYSTYIELPKKMSDLNLEVVIRDYNSYPAFNGLILQKIVENAAYYSWLYTFLLFVILNNCHLIKINKK